MTRAVSDLYECSVCGRELPPSLVLEVVPIRGGAIRWVCNPRLSTREPSCFRAGTHSATIETIRVPGDGTPPGRGMVMTGGIVRAIRSQLASSRASKHRTSRRRPNLGSFPREIFLRGIHVPPSGLPPRGTRKPSTAPRRLNPATRKTKAYKSGDARF